MSNGWHDAPPPFDGEVLATYDEHWHLVSPITGERLPGFEAPKVCENTYGMVPSPRLTDQQRSRRDAFLDEQTRLHNAAVIRRRKKRKQGRR